MPYAKLILENIRLGKETLFLIMLGIRTDLQKNYKKHFRRWKVYTCVTCTLWTFVVTEERTVCFQKTWFGNTGNKIPVLPQNNTDVAIFLFVHSKRVCWSFCLAGNEWGRFICWFWGLVQITYPHSCRGLGMCAGRGDELLCWRAVLEPILHHLSAEAKGQFDHV